jgi:hypothetical protein
MKKFLVTEDEKRRIINLHKKLIVEQSTTEVRGEVSLNFFTGNSINELPDTPTPSVNRTTSGCKKRPCTVVTDPSIKSKFDETAIVKEYPGDNNWKYVKIENNWYAKKVDGGTIYNITECECESSINKLNLEFP